MAEVEAASPIAQLMNPERPYSTVYKLLHDSYERIGPGDFVSCPSWDLTSAGPTRTPSLKQLVTLCGTVVTHAAFLRSANEAYSQKLWLRRVTMSAVNGSSDPGTLPQSRFAMEIEPYHGTESRGMSAVEGYRHYTAPLLSASARADLPLVSRPT